ncbi:MAG: hypothetical protein AAF485_11565 [Chloroflexota bacterium]
MSEKSHIVICGQSIFIMAIEASLADSLQIATTRLNTFLPDLIDRITLLNPDLVVIDSTEKSGDLVLALLEQGLSVITLAGTVPKGLMMTSQKFSISNLPQLVWLHSQRGHYQR